MVIDVTQRSLSSIISESNDVVSNIIYEFKYNNLLEKYDHLQENGTILEFDLSKIKEKVKNFIKSIVTAISKLWKNVKKKFNEIKNKVKSNNLDKTERKLQKIIDDTEKKYDSSIEVVEGIIEKVDSADDNIERYTDDAKKEYDNFANQCTSVGNSIKRIIDEDLKDRDPSTYSHRDGLESISKAFGLDIDFDAEWNKFLGINSDKSSEDNKKEKSIPTYDPKDAVDKRTTEKSDNKAKNKAEKIEEYERELELAKRNIEEDEDIIRKLKRGISEGPDDDGFYKSYIKTSDGRPVWLLEKIQRKLKLFEEDLEDAKKSVKYFEDKLKELI